MLPVRGHVQQEGQSEAAHAHPRTLQKIQMSFQVREQIGDKQDGCGKQRAKYQMLQLLLCCLFPFLMSALSTISISEELT